MKKLVVLLLLVVAMFNFVNAYSFYIDEDKARYNGYIESSVSGASDPIIETDTGDPDPNMMTLCGKQLQLEPASGGGGFFKLQDGPQKIPTDIQCSVGSKNITVYSDNSNEFYPFQITIDPFQMDPFYGEYLYLNGEADPSTINDLYLSNDTWGEDHSRPDPQAVYGNTDSAWVMVNEKDVAKQDDSAAYEASLGNRIGPNSLRMNELIDDKPSAGNHLPGRTLATSTGGNFDACEEGPCALVNNVDFGDAGSVEYNNVEIGSFGFFPESVTSAHNSVDGGEYRLEGEIMVGRKPNHANGGPDQKGPYFFLCTQGATMNNGNKQVKRVINVSDGSSEELYQCQPSQEEWQPVSSCNDGLDNDNDGQIDSTNSDYQNSGGSVEADIDSCGSSNSNSEYTSSGNTCEQGVKLVDVKVPTSGTEYEEKYVAQYSTGSGCSTDGTVEINDDIVYTEWKTSTDFTPETYPCEKGTINDGRCSNAGSEDSVYGEYSEVEVVEYYPERAFFDQYIDQLSDGEVVNTKFVGSDGWKPALETLPQAKNEYESEVLIGGESNLYMYETWDGRIRSPEVEDAYNNTANTFDNHVKAWDYANAGVTNNNISSIGSPFSGGYYGLCEEQEAWQDPVGEGNREDWECSGEIEWDQAIHLPQFEGPDLSSQMDVGLIVMGYNNQDQWSDYVNYPDDEGRTLGFDSDNTPPTSNQKKGWLSYPLATEKAPHRNQDYLDSMDVICWAGGPDNRPSSSIENGNNEGSRYLEWNNVPVLEGVPYGVTGRLDSQGDSGFDLANFNGYTCNWEYETQSSGEVNVSGQVRELHSITGDTSTTGMSKADWSAVSSIDPEFARPPSPPVSFEEGIAASRSMAAEMGWLDTPRQIFDLLGDSVQQEGNPAEDGSFDVVGYDGASSNVEIVTGDTFTPYVDDEIGTGNQCDSGLVNVYDSGLGYDGSPSYSEIDHIYSAGAPSANWGPDDDGEEPVYQCPDWALSGPGVGGEPVNTTAVGEYIVEGEGTRPPGVEFGEEGNPIANFMAAYNDPGNGMLELQYENYQELNDSLNAWKNRAN